uniref:Surfactin synthase thioesterase subunit n=1 Tax=Candidatus Kentrum sp. TUN TaxID=2126343 RepID=A0A450ZDV4_9GAMM|nr:MAG: Surfactin synthase thioesterase subunit [Candidatus Kentron sp. TUN]VFK53571.1 MAG: Surfactin synthase thioesterase subunit [Candidatus Kentron sp. TUN]VFK55025.1 MAG: Surfactin synthase thioesterase subunit [Candidatus Kentron sp. TUN]
MDNRWLAGTTNPKAKIRLFCFPFAGGGTLTYRDWPQQFPSEIEVRPVRLPGRESRFGEPCFEETVPLAQALATDLLPYLNLPFAFFGHSLGALLAFELARELRRRKEPGPLCLIVSGRRAPQLILSREPYHKLSDSALINQLRDYGGTPEIIFQEPELMALFLPVIRADFALTDGYTYVPEAPFDYPIYAFNGEADHTVLKTDMDAWRQHTSNSFVLHLLSGGHFYLSESEGPSLVRMITKELETLISQHKQ